MSKYSAIETAMSLLSKEGYGFGDPVYRSLIKERALLEKKTDEISTNVIHQKIAKFFELNRIEFKYSNDPDDQCFIYRYSTDLDWMLCSFELIEDLGLQNTLSELSLQIAKQRKWVEARSFAGTLQKTASQK